MNELNIALEGNQLYLGPYISITIGILVLFIGRRLNQAIHALREFSIPEPVSGGLLMSVVLAAVYALSAVEVSFDLQFRDILLRVNPVDERPVLVPGMSVSAQLQIPSGREGVVVARDAVVRYPDGRSVVWVIESGDTGPVAAERLIRPGLQFAGQVEIVSGLEAGEQVVVRGNETLRAGQPVQVNRGLAGASR